MRILPADKIKISAGFTLIELSIVLVIIGLIVGGILMGRDLIESAHIRAQISQMTKYSTAVQTFRGKYNGLPGDLRAGRAAQFGFAARADGLGHGNGDGKIESANTNPDGPGTKGYGMWLSGENILFWNDLSTAQLIEGSYTGIDDDNSALPITSLIPAAKLGNNYIFVYNDWGDDNGSEIHSGRNQFQISGGDLWKDGVDSNGVSPNADFSFTSSSGHHTGLGLTPHQAYSIDKKVDDGFSSTGHIRSRQPMENGGMAAVPDAGMAGYGTAAGYCSTNDTTPDTYNLDPAYVNTLICAISWRMQ